MKDLVLLYSTTLNAPLWYRKMLYSQTFHVFVQHMSEWQTQPSVWKYKNWKSQGKQKEGGKFDLPVALLHLI